MGRSPCCDENGLKKGPWTPEEDQKLVQYIQQHGHGSWRALPKLAGLNRCGKSCRLRWTNYLRPDIKRGKFSQEEEQTILNLHSILGNKWSAIATHLTGRTDNEIKNFWNTHLKKKLIQMGFDPMTHRPRTDLFSSLPQLIALANLKELMDHHQWEDHAVRLQAEAVQLAKLQYLQYILQTSMTTTSNPNSLITNNITDMEAFNNLLNPVSSFKENSNWTAFSNQLESPTSCSFGTVPTTTNNTQLVQGGVPFSQLSSSDLQVPCNPTLLLNKSLCSSDNMGQGSNFPVLFCQGEAENITKSSSHHQWVPPLSPPPAPTGAPHHPPLTADQNSNISNTGDACSTSSSYGGSGAPSFWPELLLEDPFIHEIA